MSDTETGWERFYLLGYTNDRGEEMLSTFVGRQPTVRMLSLDCPLDRLPFGENLVPDGATLMPVPSDAAELAELVRTRQGRVVIGWLMDEPVARKPRTPPPQYEGIPIPDPRRKDDNG